MLPVVTPTKPGGNDDVAIRLKESSQASPSAVESALLTRLREPVDLGPVKKASIALDVEDGDGWTLYWRDERLQLARGLDEDADTKIETNPETMVGILAGETSGVEAFITGRLRVRGNLALSLRISGSFLEGERPVRFPRALDVRARRVNTFLLEAGEGDPIVLLHGLGATNASMLTTMWDLAADRRVIAPDLPGFGDSGKPIRSYDAKFYAEWATALLDELGIERAHFIGNSLGGRVALETAMFAPERVNKLILLTPSPAFIRKREWVRVVRILRPELALLPVPLAHRHVVRSTKAMFSRPRRLQDAWYEAAADEFLRVFSSARGRIAFFSAARQIYLEEPYGEDGFWDRLGDIKSPALFIWGERDRLVPAKFAKHVTNALPDSQSVVLDDCGHVPQFELPEETHALARKFLDERPS
jgi:pimeloyl-ACP methyl ester carboxylesterase/putative sterol carrier protein